MADLEKSALETFSALPAAVTVCDAEGIITYMNSAAEQLLAKHGGRALIGSNLFDCHPPKAQEKIRSLMRDRTANTYTTEKAGVKRLIHQSPWYRGGVFAGLVEISFEVPPILPNFKRE
ncbi:MAG: PAS domain-containing protein [Anaerolineales bacterium]|nr:PAS domain-containing protein [Anaerolineales bacterium]